MSKTSKRPGRATRSTRGRSNSEKTTAMPRSLPNELAERLTEQIRYLHTSARLYDDGDEAEAKRLATAIRTLVVDTKSMKSVLGQMRLLDSLMFEDTAGPLLAGNHLTEWNLTSLVTGPGGAGTLAALWIPRMQTPAHETYPPRPFAIWWAEPVVKDAAGTYFSRCDLVLFVGNKDGGNHVDPRLPEHYWKLTRANSLAWVIHDSRGDTPMESNPVLPALRQIAQEVLLTLKRHEDDLSPLGVTVLDPPERQFKPPSAAA